MVVHLLIAKTKLAPIRSLRPQNQPMPRMTIPKLELRAALMAVRTLRLLASDLGVLIDRCQAWTDSQIVLS